jgi:hypothetical protein
MKAPKRLIEGRARIAAEIIVRARIVVSRADEMGASHFFVGMGAGIAILSVPVLTLGPGRDLPSQLSAWINAHVRTDTGQEGWLPARYVSP